MAKITHARFTLSPFSSEQMEELGNAVLVSIKARIHKGETVDEQPARPLKPDVKITKRGSVGDWVPYAVQKQRRGLQPIRDLFNTGALMSSLCVISANEDRCILGSNNVVKDFLLHRNNKRSPQFGMSETDTRAMQTKVRELLERSIQVVTHE